MTRLWFGSLLLLVTACSSPLTPTPTPTRRNAVCVGDAPCTLTDLPPTLAPLPADVQLLGSSNACVQASYLWPFWDLTPNTHQVLATAASSPTPGCQPVIAPVHVLPVSHDRYIELDAHGACGRTQYELRLDGRRVAWLIVDTHISC